MKVYDFDKTIFSKDSTTEFLITAYKKKPLRFFETAVKILIGLVKGKIKSSSDVKEVVYGILKYIDDPETLVEEFWSTRRGLVENWYMNQKDNSDVIISGSPYFLLKSMADWLDVRLIATDMDIKTGQINGVNCKGDEKVRRFRENFPDEIIEEFYSDSLSDTPMAKIAEMAYLVKKGKRTIFPISKAV